jgi:hypothetical protein
MGGPGGAGLAGGRSSSVSRRLLRSSWGGSTTRPTIPSLDPGVNGVDQPDRRGGKLHERRGKVGPSSEFGESLARDPEPISDLGDTGQGWQGGPGKLKVEVFVGHHIEPDHRPLGKPGVGYCLPDQLSGPNAYGRTSSPSTDKRTSQRPGPSVGTPSCSDTASTRASTRSSSRSRDAAPSGAAHSTKTLHQVTILSLLGATALPLYVSALTSSAMPAGSPRVWSGPGSAGSRRPGTASGAPCAGCRASGRR